MNCEHCGQKEATMYYRTNINGIVTEHRLCGDCALELGLQLPQAHSPVASVLGDFFHARSGGSAGAGIVCPACGATHRSIAQAGKAGCAQCYEVFSGLFGPYIRRIHGDLGHKGKIPLGAGTQLRTRREIEQLQTQMQDAVERQNFEEAARLRDRIRALEGGGGI